MKEYSTTIIREIKLQYNSKAEFARKLGITRASAGVILKKIEQGKDIKLSTLEKICDVLGYKFILIKDKK